MSKICSLQALAPKRNYVSSRVKKSYKPNKINEMTKSAFYIADLCVLYSLFTCRCSIKYAFYPMQARAESKVPCTRVRYVSDLGYVSKTQTRYTPSYDSQCNTCTCYSEKDNFVSIPRLNSSYKIDVKIKNKSGL